MTRTTATCPLASPTPSRPVPSNQPQPYRSGRPPSQQVRKPQAEQPQHARGAVQPDHLERGRPGGTALAAAAPAIAGRARVDGSAVRRGAAGSGGRRRPRPRPRGRRRVRRRGVERPAGVVAAAGGRARVVLPARRHALGAPLGADEVGERQGVLGDVGPGPVAAEAAVREAVLFGWKEAGRGICQFLSFLVG